MTDLSAGTVRPVAICIILISVVVVPVSATVYFASSAPGIITKGDPFSVGGTGAINGTVGIWIIGRDHFEILTTAPDRHGNFSLSIKPSATEKFSSGQYVVIFQDPGAGGILDIGGGTDTEGNLAMMNRGKIVTRLGPRQDLGANAHLIADNILSTSLIPGVDDIFIAEYFFVAEPAIYFDNLIPASGFRLPDQVTGDRIIITGTTNIGTDNTLSTAIQTQKNTELVTTKTMAIRPGNSLNTWTWDLDAPGLPPGDYELIVSWVKENTTATGVFSVKPPVSLPPLIGMPQEQKTLRQEDFTFPVFVGCSLIVLAIVLYFAGRE